MLKVVEKGNTTKEKSKWGRHKHSKSEKVSGFYPSALKNLQKKRINFDAKIVRQCINQANSVYMFFIKDLGNT